MKAISVGSPESDQLFLEWIESDGKIHQAKLSGIGCLSLLNSILEYRSLLKGDWKSVKIPSGTDHVSILLRELLLRAQGLWLLPYPLEELCHCRAVPTDVVVKCIRAGAHTPHKISQLTTASTSCGTCRSDVEALIDYIAFSKSS